MDKADVAEFFSAPFLELIRPENGAADSDEAVIALWVPADQREARTQTETRKGDWK